MAQSFPNFISKLKSKVTPRRVVIALIVVITIFLPTTFAIATVIQSQLALDDSARIHTASLYDKNARLLFFEDQSADVEDENSLVDIFTTVKSNLEPINELPIQEKEREPLTVELKSDLKTERLICYFTLSDDPAYCTDEAGKHYTIQKSDNELFITSPFSETLYATSIPPLLSSADSDTIPPSVVSWSFLNTDGTVLPSQKIQTAERGLSYIFSESISLSFASTPDSCSVQILDGDKRIDCSLDTLDSLVLSNHDGIRVLVSANWKKAEGRSFFGTATYDFYASIHNRSEFILSQDTLSVGEFAFVKITEVSDASKLSFKSDDASLSLDFIIDGNVAFAVIPWSILEGKDTVDFTLTYGASSRDFTVSAASSYSAISKDLRAQASALGIKPSQVNAEPLKYVFFLDNTVAPSEQLFEKTVSFGIENSDTPLSFCNEYVCKSTRGATVGASAGGKVIAVGNIQESKYVVVDAGLGIRIWYLYLSVADVTSGDIVAVGDAIGKTGELSDTSKDGFAVAVSFENTFIDPDFIIN